MPVRAPDDARPGTGRCFVSRTATGEKRRVFCRSTYCIFIDISLLKTKIINTKIYISFEELRIINMHLQVLLKFCSLDQVFSSPSLSELASIFLILTTCFFGEMVANFDINLFTIARENSCKIDRAPYGVRLISYNAGRTPYDIVRCPAGHRPMLSYTDVDWRPYDM